MKLYKHCEETFSKDPRTKAIVTHAQEQTSLVSLWIEEMH